LAHAFTFQLNIPLSRISIAFSWTVSFSPAQQFGGDTGHDGKRRHVFCHHCASPDYASLSDCYTGEDDGVYANVSPGLDLNLFDFKVCLDDRDLDRRTDMG
jgi:hypothetical protein